MPASSEPISSSQPERPRGVDRDRRQGLVRRQAEVRGRPRSSPGAGSRSVRCPGLKSVPIATGTPRSMNVRAGAWWSFMRNQVVAGRSVATTGSALGRGRGQGVDAGLATASRDGRPRRPRSRPRAPRRPRAPARRRGAAARSPKPAAASRIRRDWSALNTPVLAEDVAEAGAALGGDAGQLLVDHGADVGLGAVRPARNSGGTACAPRNVGTTSIGPSRPSW